MIHFFLFSIHFYNWNIHNLVELNGRKICTFIWNYLHFPRDLAKTKHKHLGTEFIEDDEQCYIYFESVK